MYIIHSETGGTESYNGLAAALMMDDVRIAEVFTKNVDPVHLQHQQAATTAVVDCPAGGKVWVQSLSNLMSNLMRVWGKEGIPRSVFTGFAIFYF